MTAAAKRRYLDTAKDCESSESCSVDRIPFANRTTCIGRDGCGYSDSELDSVGSCPRRSPTAGQRHRVPSQLHRRSALKDSSESPHASQTPPPVSKWFKSIPKHI